MILLGLALNLLIFSCLPLEHTCGRRLYQGIVIGKTLVLIRMMDLRPTNNHRYVCCSPISVVMSSPLSLIFCI